MIALNLHDHFSLRRSTIRTEDIPDKLIELGYKGAALTNLGNVASAVKFQSGMKEKGLKSVIGCKVYLSDRKSVNVYAKNLQGWKNLLRVIKQSNLKDSYYYGPEVCYQKPTISFEDLAIICSKNCAVALGHDGSAKNYKDFYDAFGKNLWLEITDKTKHYEDVAKSLQLKTVPCRETFYFKKEDASDHRILLAIDLKVTLKECKDKINEAEDSTLSRFFSSNSYFLRPAGTLTQEENNHIAEFVEQFEEYSILSKPDLPSFECPNGWSQIEYVRQICLNGWKDKIKGVVSQNDLGKYAERVKYELGVLAEASLAGYFLIVWDIIRWAHENNIMTGLGRGSAAGSMTAYLMNITRLIDPIKHGLLFERFYNSSRKGSMPDIDLDFPVEARERIIKYIEQKYGIDKVAHIATYGSFQGRSILKDVLRVHDACGFSETNKVTKYVPDKAKIADDLQEMEEQGEESSIILWALQHNAKHLKEWCYIEEDGSFAGPLGHLFAQAARLEGLKRNIGKHASGIIISSVSLEEKYPLILSKDGEDMICGVEYVDAEKMGALKVDILGATPLDKLVIFKKLIAGEELE